MSADELSGFMQYATAVGFVLLAALVARRWLETRDPGRAWLVVATGALAAVAVIGRVQDALGTTSAVGQHVTLVLFLASGYALLRFRDVLLPLQRATRIVAGVAAVSLAAFAVVVGLPVADAQATSLQLAGLFAVVGLWVVFVGEPVVRLVRLGAELPSVQRARTRSLAVGYGLIIVILLIAVPSSGSEARPMVRFATQLGALAAIPMLFAAFEPPAWLRRAWRGPIEGDLARATVELLGFVDDRQALADRALTWARRLVGADSGFLRTADGIVALDRIEEAEADALISSLEAHGGSRLVPADASRYAIVVPLGGAGVMGVVSGAFTPIFGSDEVDRLIPFAASIGTALERVRVEDERHRYARELERANRDLARTNEDLERFAFIASHDLQEPLRMVSGYVQLLGRNYQGRLDADADEFIGYAVEGVTRMRTLLDELLAFSRIGTRGSPVERVDTGEIVADVRRELKASIAASGADLTVDPLPEVVGDRDQLRLVFRHLIDNAVKFRSERSPRIRIGAVRGDGAWEFSVADDGIGIDAAFADRIFVIFQRLHPRGEYPGTGVGLAMCDRIVQRHGGRIWVESQPGAGSTFRFTIPVQEGDE